MVELDQRESELVLRLLKDHLGDLRMTISNTEKYEWRQQMKADEQLMKELIARLEAAVAAERQTA